MTKWFKNISFVSLIFSAGFIAGIIFKDQTFLVRLTQSDSHSHSQLKASNISDGLANNIKLQAVIGKSYYSKQIHPEDYRIQENELEEERNRTLVEFFETHFPYDEQIILDFKKYKDEFEAQEDARFLKLEKLYMLPDGNIFPYTTFEQRLEKINYEVRHHKKLSKLLGPKRYQLYREMVKTKLDEKFEEAKRKALIEDLSDI